MNFIKNNLLLTLAIIFAVIGLILWIVSSINMIKKDLHRMNLTLNKVANEIGTTEELKNELKKLLLEGKKVEAIKKYKNATGVGLIEARQYVDSLV